MSTRTCLRNSLLSVAAVAVLLVSAGSALAAATNTIPYAEDFEGFAVGYELVGSSDGWYGANADSGVIATNSYEYLLPRPIGDESDTKVLNVSSTITNIVAPTNFGNVYLDTMVKINYRDEPGHPTVTNAQIAMYVNTNGQLVVRHGVVSGPSIVPQWTTLNNETLYEDEWIRLTVPIDYGSDTIFGYNYFQIRIDGRDAITDAVAYESPSGFSSLGGSWFLTANIDNDYVSSFTTEGSAQLDDFVLSDTATLTGASNTITATAGTGGRISPRGEVNVAVGADQKFKISADVNYEIESITVNSITNVTITDTAMMYYTISNVTADATIAATFMSLVPTVDVDIDTLWLLGDKLWLNATGSDTGGTPQVWFTSNLLDFGSWAVYAGADAPTYSNGFYTISLDVPTNGPAWFFRIGDPN